MGHLVVLLHIPFLIPTCKWAEFPPPRRSTSVLLPKHWVSDARVPPVTKPLCTWDVQQQVPDWLAVTHQHANGSHATKVSCQCWWHKATSKAERESNEAEGKRM